MASWKLVGLGVFVVAIAASETVAFVEGKSLNRLQASARPQQTLPSAEPDQARLHNGWVLHPVGEQTPIGDMPTQMALSPDGAVLAVLTTGWQKPALSLFRVGPSRPETRTSDTSYPRGILVSLTLPDAWRGLAFGKGERDRTIFVSGGSTGVVERVRFDEGWSDFSRLSPIELPKRVGRPYTGAVAVLPNGDLLAIDEASGKASGHDMLYRFDPEGKLLREIDIARYAGSMVASPDGQSAYVADEENGKLLCIDLGSGKTTSTIDVGSQPAALLFGSGGRLYCANSGSDTISVVDLEKSAVVATWAAAPKGTSVLGSVPNGLALSPDGSRLFVTNGGNNDVTVLSTADGRWLGAIPTGRYPVSVAVSPDSSWLFVGVGKGLRTRPNDSVSGVGPAHRVGQPEGQKYGPNHGRDLAYDYILSTVSGSLTRIPMPDERELAIDTGLVAMGTPYRVSLLRRAEGGERSAMPNVVGRIGPIKHVLYIIKENRTYDQVLGDMKKGNGDPNLVLFGAQVTPNHHKIADQFVLLDNLYCDGEVSQDGWEWSCAANDSDWDTKATLRSYGRNVQQPGQREAIRPSNGYLWENAEQHGLSYFSYGAKTFQGLFSPTWKEHLSKAFDEARAAGKRDDQRADIFISDLHDAQKTGQWPSLMLMSLPEDHTTGTRPGTRTPYASVAGNDLAVGKIVEAISHSKFWKETVIFVIEDDAQNGPDHVDAHRTVGLVVSPYSRKGTVDHNMYTSSSMVRSIELLLGLPPRSQYDAGAAPMFASFDGKLDLTPYVCEPARVDITALNTPRSVMAKVSQGLDFSDYDRADPDTLNRVLWAYARPGKRYPGIRLSASP